MISSTADQIIDFVKVRGAVELSEVAAHIGKDENYTKRILALLEKEGLVKINYRWTKFIINWAGEQTIVPLKPGYVILGREEEMGETKIAETKDQKKVEGAERPKVKKKAKEEVERKEKVEKVEKEGLVKSEIVAPPSPPSLPLYYEDEFRELKEKISEIETKKAEIEALQREREHLFEEAVVPLAARLDAEVGTLSDYIKEKERTISETKERLRRFSERAEGLELECEKFDLVVAEARKKFSALLSELSGAISAIKQSQSKIRAELNECRAAVQSQSAEIATISKRLEQFDGSAIERSIAQLKRKVDEYSSEIASIEQKFSERAESVGSISQRAVELEGKIAALSSALSDIEKKADAAYELQGTIENVRASYERALNEFDKEVARATKELAGARRAASARAVAEYAKELESIEKKFEEELAAVTKREEELNARIAKAKEELRQAIDSMRALSKKLRAQATTAGGISEERPKGGGLFSKFLGK